MVDGGLTMAPGQYFTPYQRGLVNRFYEQQDTRLYQRLTEYVSELAASDDSQRKSYLWRMVQRDLARTPADQMKVARLIGERRLEEVAKMVNDLEAADKLIAKPVAGAAPGVAVPVVAPAAAASAATKATAATAVDDAKADSLAPARLKSALAAFKKRLKITKLDAESKLSVRALTGGQRSGIVAIQAPTDYPKAVWEELVKQGKIRHAGSGLYELCGV